VSHSGRSLASRIAFGTFLVSILHLVGFACWVFYDLTLATYSGCFTDEGLLELLVLGLSFTLFSTVSLCTAIRARRWRLVIAAALCLALVVCLGVIVSTNLFF
jgi:hypothetical protein